MSSKLAPSFGVQCADLPATDKARDPLRAQNDKTVTRLCGLSAAEPAPVPPAHVQPANVQPANVQPGYLALLAPA